VTVLSRSPPWFPLQAGFLILVATIAGVLHLNAWAIAVVMAGAFAAVVFGERFMTRNGGARASRKVAAPDVAEPEPAAKSLLRPPVMRPVREPVRPRPRPVPAAGAAAPAGPVKPAPTWPSASMPKAPAPPPPSPPVVQRRRWNVFDLQNRASGIATTDPERHEEFTFLLLYLRGLADVAGDLTEEFDGFVRESFPELVSAW
jgi:hypothetical protein